MSASATHSREKRTGSAEEEEEEDERDERDEQPSSVKVVKQDSVVVPVAAPAVVPGSAAPSLPLQQQQQQQQQRQQQSAAGWQGSGGGRRAPTTVAVPDRIGKRPASIANSPVFTSVEHTRGSKLVRDEYAVAGDSVTRSITWMDAASGDEIQYLLKGRLGGDLRLTKYFKNKQTGAVEVDYSDTISSAESEARYGMPGMAAAVLFDIPDFLNNGGPPSSRFGGADDNNNNNSAPASTLAMIPAALPPPTSAERHQQQQYPQQQQSQYHPGHPYAASAAVVPPNHHHNNLSHAMGAFTFVPISLRNPNGQTVTAFLPLLMSRKPSAA